MNLVNATKLVAGYTMATDKTGREWLVVVAKGTYGIPDRPDHEPALLEEQAPLVMTDEFTGEPGFSAPLYEIDFAPRKPRCDVLLNGSCHAPGGKPATKVPVTMQVGSLSKTFNVVGNRVYKAGLLYRMPGEPEPFTVMPISYNNAYGGVDKPSEDPKTHKWYPTNHAGVGYHPGASPKALDGKPMPNTEEVGHAVSKSNGSYKPMAYGPVGRSWQPRIKWAGTYDKKWLDETFPFLPVDFDERYFQCAPEDQQTDYLKGGEEVVLTNLTPQGRTTFHLPGRLKLPVVFFSRDIEPKEVPAVADTLLLEPDKNQFILVWRASLALRRTLREVTEMNVGRTARQCQRLERRAKQGAGKRRFASLAELVQARRSKKSY
jgi:hypothetical protein